MDGPTRPPYRGGMRAPLSLVGDRDAITLPRALVSTSAKGTILSPRVASQITRERGPARCIWGGVVLGEICGPTVKAAVALDGCRGVDIRAVVAPLPRGVRAVVGGDVVRRTVKEITFGGEKPVIACRR